MNGRDYFDSIGQNELVDAIIKTSTSTTVTSATMTLLLHCYRLLL